MPRSHPLRRELNDEAHQRPFTPVPCPSRLTSLAILVNNREQARSNLADLAHRLGLPAPTPKSNQYRGQVGDITLRWALHTEFARYTVIVDGPSPHAGNPFAEPALTRVPCEWLHQLPGEVLVAMHAVVMPMGHATPDADRLSEVWFEGNDLIGATIGEGNGLALTDLRLHPDSFFTEGASRLLLLNKDMSANQTGRMLQRLFEIETYRMLALLALPLAKQQIGELSHKEERLNAITSAMRRGEEPDASLLAQITQLAGEMEAAISTSHYRYSASRAYYALVERRITELRESRYAGLQPFREFMERRLEPAMETCATAARRQEMLSQRLQRATSLLRTRVEVMHEAQNQALLASMNKRAALQLRLQETVEGLSVAVITYYLTGLTSYGAKALSHLGINIDPELVAGTAIIPIAIVVWAGMQAMRRRLRSAEKHS